VGRGRKSACRRKEILHIWRGEKRFDQKSQRKENVSKKGVERGVIVSGGRRTRGRARETSVENDRPSKGKGGLGEGGGRGEKKKKKVYREQPGWKRGEDLRVDGRRIALFGERGRWKKKKGPQSSIRQRVQVPTREEEPMRVQKKVVPKSFPSGGTFQKGLYVEGRRATKMLMEKGRKWVKKFKIGQKGADGIISKR